MNAIGVTGIIGIIGIILVLVGGTSWLIARGRSGIDWDNPGWKSGILYSYGTILWSFGIFASTGISGYSLLALGSLLFISLSLILRKYTPENKKFTYLDKDRYGSLRHSRLVSFLYILSFPPMWFIGFSAIG